MSDSSLDTLPRLRAAIAHEHTLILQDETCRSRFLLHPHRTEKVFLFFHGFTAVPQQFLALGQLFYQAGYNVLIPLLPGHGLAGEWNANNPPPLPEQAAVYEAFGREWLARAREVGDRLILGGLSGGSTLAAWLSLEYPAQVDRSLLFAPYLGNQNVAVDWVIRQWDFYFKWHVAANTVSYGYEGFLSPALRVFLTMGTEVLQRAEIEPMAPFLMVESESDRAVNHKKNKKLLMSALRFQPRSQYHWFDQKYEIPHNMMTREEGNERDGWVRAIAKAYVDAF